MNKITTKPDSAKIKKTLRKQKIITNKKDMPIP